MLRLAASETDHLRCTERLCCANQPDGLDPSRYLHYDVCAMTEDDRDISDALLHQYLEMV